MQGKRGRPARGAQRRVRTSFTIPPGDVLWLKETSRNLRMSKSQLLEKVLAFSKAGFSPANYAAIEGVKVPVPSRQVEEFCRRNFIRKLSLFGSVRTEQFTAESDIDVLAEFEEGKSPSLFALSNLQRELSLIFNGRRVDLRTPDELSRYFKDDVVREAVPIYG